MLQNLLCEHLRLGCGNRQGKAISAQPFKHVMDSLIRTVLKDSAPDKVFVKMRNRRPGVRFTEAVKLHKALCQGRADKRAKRLQIRLLNPICPQGMLHRLRNSFLWIRQSSIQIK